MRGQNFLCNRTFAPKCAKIVQADAQADCSVGASRAAD